MIKANLISLFITILTALSSCSNSDNKDSGKQTTQEAIKDSIQSISIEKRQVTQEVTSDSIQLTTLVRQVSNWHMTERLGDFPYEFDNLADSIFIGIDWEAYDKNIEIFKMTNFFSDTFLSNHKKIALIINTSIKKADIEWRNINDGIPLWVTGADNWCGCQDYPDNYWEFITIDSLNIQNNYAGFNWTWDNSQSSYPFSQEITAEKINDRWKISSIEGFNYFDSVEDYDRIMKK
jgi:hypothetical protein